MAVKHKRVVNKRERAQALADRLKGELGLTICEPVLTGKDAAKYDLVVSPDRIFLHLAIPAMSCNIPLAPKPFFHPDYGQEDEDYYFRLVTRVWLTHLKAAAQEIMARGI